VTPDGLLNATPERVYGKADPFSPLPFTLLPFTPLPFTTLPALARQVGELISKNIVKGKLEFLSCMTFWWGE